MRLNVVLRDALALAVHDAEQGLSEGIALFRQRSPQPQSRRIIAALLSGQAVLKRPRNRCARQHQGENDTGQDALEHG